MVSALASAQNADYQPRGVGYVFAGGGTHSMGLTAGFGGEAYIAKGLGLGAEVAAGGLTTTDNYGQSKYDWAGVGRCFLPLFSQEDPGQRLAVCGRRLYAFLRA